MTIGVFFGSRNPEHDISIITGELIISELKKLGHAVMPVYIDKKGQWYIDESLGSLKLFTQNQLEKAAAHKRCYLDLEVSNGRLVFKKKGLAGKEIAIDLAFPALHGQNGEDGTMQGLFEIFNIPYVGCDVPSSAIAMDKVLTKLMYRAYGIPTTEFVSFTGAEWEGGREAIIKTAEKKIGWSMIVKPARLGSSIGIAKAKNKKELETAIEVALKYDDKAIVEKAVENLADITVAVMGHSKPVASLIQEAVIEKDLFTYEEKYLEEGGAQLGNAQKKIVIPARLDAKHTDEIRALAVDIFKKFGCSGIARVDFLYDVAAKQYYANEINPLPGTLYHHLWKAGGVEIGDLLERLIAAAGERHEEKARLMHTFDSDILKFANSVKLKIDKQQK